MAWNGSNQQSNFDWDVYGANPYMGFVDSMDDWLDEAGNPFTTGYDPSNKSGNWGTHIARVTDPEVQEYMSHLMGGQQKSLQDYVSRAAGAGIKRGGMNVAGGPALESSLQSQAMNTLAGGYSDRFKSAMDYNKYYQGELQSAANKYRDDLIKGLGMQLQGLNAYGGWNERMGDRRQGEYQSNLNWRRGANARDQAQIAYNQGQDAKSLAALQNTNFQNAFGDASRTLGTYGPSSLKPLNNYGNTFDIYERMKTGTGQWGALSRSTSPGGGGGRGGGGSAGGRGRWGGGEAQLNPGAMTYQQGYYNTPRQYGWDPWA